MTLKLDTTARRSIGEPSKASRIATAAYVLPAALLLSVALGGSARAAEPGVTCGSTVTTDVTLTADLYCPSGDGLILGSNVTLDLGGHSLIGSDSGVGVSSEFPFEGGNTIRNGTIENWAIGIRLMGIEPNPIPYVATDLVLINAPVGNYFTNGTTLQLTRVTAVDSPIRGELGGDLAISDSSLTRSPVEVFFASATITNSKLVETFVSTTAGGELSIDSSKLDGKGTAALGYVSETVITITDSVVKNYAQPISGFWGGVTLTGNKFSDMPNGVLGSITSGIESDGVSGITGNTFVRSGVALRGNVPMVVENNTFRQGEVGVEFTMSDPLPGNPPQTADRSRAVGNVLVNNTGSGILTELPGLEVGGNTAKNNGGYGIYAPGAVDLGGNVASGNALGQCVGVVCARK
ncbi:right-handed parallel beta-helix repeat-containing protein [Micromonospora sp. DT81.3]|uniref:right-handed parallel beta-helix repeat-containing protein n=1 Tax=Micromonospora sp. DT81.3 TaxID=3416523 RepID=UPI003CEE7D37